MPTLVALDPGHLPLNWRMVLPISVVLTIKRREGDVKILDCAYTYSHVTDGYYWRVLYRDLDGHLKIVRLYKVENLPSYPSYLGWVMFSPVRRGE